MSCCDNSTISIFNGVAHDLKIVDVAHDHGKIGGFKRGDIVRSGKTVTGKASSSIADARAKGSITCAVADYPEFEIELGFDFKPSGKLYGYLCPCVTTTRVKSNSEQLIGTERAYDGQNKGEARAEFVVKSQDAISPPRIDPKRWIANAPQDGPWQVGNRVRYAVMFYKADGRAANDGTFHWSEWITIGAWAFPTVTGIARSITGQAARRVLVREFAGYGEQTVATFEDNATTEWVDRNTSFP